MTKAIPTLRRIELLLNTLGAERYLRRPLLAELVDELAEADASPEALRAARALLDGLGALDQPEYQRQVARLAELACRSSLAGASGSTSAGA